jgi:hypothetical protein
MYEITPLDNQIAKKPSIIPLHPFTCSVVASKGLGKSTLVLNMILKMYFGLFHKIFWISPTSFLDSKVQILAKTKGVISINKPLIKAMKKEQSKELMADNLQIDEDSVTHLTKESFIEKLDLNWLMELIEHQKQVSLKYGKALLDNILIVLDDSISERLLRHTKFIDFILKSRHYMISVLFSSQSYMLLDTTLRKNTSFLILYQTNNERALRQIYEENSCNLSYKDFLYLFQKTTSVPYGFLSMNFQNTDLRYRLINCFKEFYLIE